MTYYHHHCYYLLRLLLLLLPLPRPRPPLLPVLAVTAAAAAVVVLGHPLILSTSIVDFITLATHLRLIIVLLVKDLVCLNAVKRRYIPIRKTMLLMQEKMTIQTVPCLQIKEVRIGCHYLVPQKYAPCEAT